MAKGKGNRGREKSKVGLSGGRRPLYLYIALSLFAIAVALALVFSFYPAAHSFLSPTWENVLESVGIGLILVLVVLLAWLLWRWRGTPFPKNLNRGLGVVVLIFAFMGFLSFFGVDKASSGSLSQYGYGGWVGHQIIGDSIFVGAFRFLGVAILGLVLLFPRGSWNVTKRVAPPLGRFYQSHPLHLYFWYGLCSFVYLYRRFPLHRAIIACFKWRAEPASAPPLRKRPATREAAAPGVESVAMSPAEAPAVAGEAVAPQAEPVAVPSGKRWGKGRKAAAPEAGRGEVAEPDKGEPARAVAAGVGETIGTAGAIEAAKVAEGKWQLPSLNLLERNSEIEPPPVDTVKGAKIIEEALASYGVGAKVVQVNVGPAVTQYGVEPGWDIKTRQVKKKDKDGKDTVHVEEVSRTRVKVERIASLANDLALALEAPSIKIEAPIPGKAMVGIEVPNPVASMVSLRSIIETTPFQKLRAKTRLPLALGKGVSGEGVVADLAKMPHLLIAGATGSGKSICMKSIIVTFLMYSTPDEMRLLMIDPKRVELVVFNNIPHLLTPVIVDVGKAVEMLKWLSREMDHRYDRLAALGARDIESYNKNPRVDKPLSRLLLVVDELAELMMTAPDEVERLLCRLAQLARATGIHLVVATQRPSVDVVTGLIKANFPARISFAVASQVDSRTILDTVGAEKLLGQGDMLFLPPDAPKPRRLQGTFVSEAEMDRVVSHWITQRPRDMDIAQMEQEMAQASSKESHDDVLLEKAKGLAQGSRHISTSFLQRKLGIGYPRAAKIMDLLEGQGVVSPGEPGKSREVLKTDGGGGGEPK